jgi:hypothetical protein
LLKLHNELNNFYILPHINYDNEMRVDYMGVKYDTHWADEKYVHNYGPEA